MRLKNGHGLGGKNVHYKNGLRGLRAAAFIADSLAESKDKKWIVSRFNGDEQLVNMWISFIHHNRWVNKACSSEEWSLTDKGKKRINSLMKGGLAFFNVLLTIHIKFDPANIPLAA